MNAHQPPPPTPLSKPIVSSERGSLLLTLRNMWPYIWPADRPDLKMRVVIATGLLVLAKVATLAVPFTFKWATDGLVAASDGKPMDMSWWTWALAAPIAMTLAYGITRVVMAVITQVRDGMFAKVAMHAVRRLAVVTFDHMHVLSLRFHLERKTGGLARVLDRARLGIETLSRMVILQLLPTFVEVLLVAVVLLYMFNWRYVAVIAVTIGLYTSYTYFATEWRIGIRKRMNDSDTEANTKAIDSLLNYETVKYFGAEERESARYDKTVKRYEEASVKSYTSLAVLNAGQARDLHRRA